MVKKSIRKIVHDFCKVMLEDGIDFDRIILYGSYADGKWREDSDIDVAVVSKSFGKDRVDEGMQLFRLAGAIDPRLEPIPISLDSYEHDTWIPLIHEIKSNGVEISFAKSSFKSN